MREGKNGTRRSEKGTFIASDNSTISRLQEGKKVPTSPSPTSPETKAAKKRGRERERAEAKWLKQCRKFSRGLTIHEMICISKCRASRQTNGTHGELKSFSSGVYLHARCKYDHAVGPEKKVAGSFSKMAPGWIFGQVFRVILEIEDVDRDRERVGAKQKQRGLLRPFFVRPHFTRERVPFQFLKD